MQPLTEQGRRRIDELAQRYQLSTDAVMTLLQALINSNGAMAQFNHADLGGSGQWMRGGMTMISDMFNHGLKARVDGVCSELSQLLVQQPIQPAPSSFQPQSQGGHPHPGFDAGGGPVSLFVADPRPVSGRWWPEELGLPNGSGAQNQVRYAYFNLAHRLAVELNGRVTVYDTLDHQIGGVSQQQGSGGSLTFTSQYGKLSISTLPVVSVDGVARDLPEPRHPPGATAQAPPRAQNAEETDIFIKIERLADLHQKGIVSPEEFAAKKKELLSRL